MSWAKATQLQVKKKIFKTEKKKKFFHILYCRHVLLHDWAIHDFHTRFPTIFHFAFNLPLEVAGKSLFDVISDLTSWSFNFNVFFLFFFYSDFFFLLFFPPYAMARELLTQKIIERKFEWLQSLRRLFFLKFSKESMEIKKNFD